MRQAVHVSMFGILFPTMDLHFSEGLFQFLDGEVQSHVRAVCLGHRVEA